jgi:4a-hydroxytetrahydrobiopterin dehydratase
VANPVPTRQPLSAAEIESALRGLPHWRRNGSAIERELRFPSFRQAMSFLAAGALACEKLDHHPDWSNSYDRVSIALSTHSARGLTGLDFQLAEELERLAEELGA